MKNKHIFIPLFVFLGAGLVSLIWSVIDFKGVNKQLSYSSETIQFNYDGASDGYDPYGRSFDAINFMTDDVSLVKNIVLKTSSNTSLLKTLSQKTSSKKSILTNLYSTTPIQALVKLPLKIIILSDIALSFIKI